MKKKNLFTVLLVVIFIFGSNLLVKNYEAESMKEKLINLSFVPGDSIVDSSRPFMYAVNSSSKSVYSINYETEEDPSPLSITYSYPE